VVGSGTTVETAAAADDPLSIVAQKAGECKGLKPFNAPALQSHFV
jgi:hypothetical protein